MIQIHPNGGRLEATSEQRQRLLEGIFHRNDIRRRAAMPPLNITRAYAVGLNRILSENLKKQKPQMDHQLSKEDGPRAQNVICLNGAPPPQS